MSESRELARKALKRLLANGPLTAMPKRPADQNLLALLAAAQLGRQGSFGEPELNERLTAWLATLCAPFGIDHVTLRRLMVDSRMLTRTRSGSIYQVNPERTGEIEAIGKIDPADVLAEARHDRDRRKRGAEAEMRAHAMSDADKMARQPIATQSSDVSDNRKGSL